MKHSIPPFFIFFALVLAGCDFSSVESSVSDIPPPAAVYKEGYGLQFSPGAREIADLKTTEVVERVLGAAERGPVIPATAIVHGVKGDFVYVANGPWFVRTSVTLGASEGEWTRVTDGLYDGDAVVSRGARTLWLAELQAVNGGVGCTHGK